jgi:hypothetical protein
MNRFHTPLTAASRSAALAWRRVAGASVVLLAVAGAVQPAAAGERSVTVTGQGGKTLEHEVSRTRGQASSTTTGPNGQSVSREVERGGGRSEAAVTGTNGRTWQRVVERDADGRDVTRTGPRGRTVERSRARGERR